jgi:hypothetical protein
MPDDFRASRICFDSRPSAFAISWTRCFAIEVL